MSKSRFDPLAIELSDVLDRPSFRAAWGEWAKHRREIHKSLTETTCTKQLRQLEGFGLAGALASIEQSITAGWVGLFAPKDRERVAEIEIEHAGDLMPDASMSDELRDLTGGREIG